MKLRCRPGAVCRIDRSVSSEGNVGAFITVTRAIPNEAGLDTPAWEFTQASRPLLIVCNDTSLKFTVRASADRPERWVWMRDAQLTPITPPPGTVIDEAAEPVCEGVAS